MDKAFEFQYFGPIPSTNHIYGTGKGGQKFLKKDVKAFRGVVGIIARSAMARYKIKKAGKGVSVWVEIAVEMEGKGRDLDNVLKSFLDGMNGIVYADDSQVDFLSIIRREKTALSDSITTKITLSERGKQ